MNAPLNADLHCHSVVSDGTLTPEELAARAKAQIEQLTREQQARTDHQTLLTRQRRAASPAGRKLEQH